MTTDQSKLPVPVPSQMEEISALASAPEARQRFVCKNLLVGETRSRADAEAADTLPKILDNPQILAVFGNDALDDLNSFTDQLLSERRSVDVPELEEILTELGRRMRGIGRKYDPSDPKNIEKYRRSKSRLLSFFRLGRTFFEELMADVRSLDQQFNWAIEQLTGKQELLLRNVAYFDQIYDLEAQAVEKLIYKIAVMEIIRDLAAEQAEQIVIGDSNLGDQGQEQRGKITDQVTLLEQRIINFKARVFLAWAAAPQTRGLSTLAMGVSADIGQTVGVTIPTMKRTVVLWQMLSDTEKAAQINQAVKETFNQVVAGFYKAAQVAVPEIAAQLATPTLDPRTVVAMTQSLAAQADGVIAAIKLGHKKREELEATILFSRDAIDAATDRVNEAKLEEVLAAAKAAEAPLEIATSVPVAKVESGS